MSSLLTSFDPALIARFDVNGPRYTSYPTADRFSTDFGAQQVGDAFAERAKNSAQRAQRDFSLYFHLPFCQTICYYCACNKITTRDHGRSSKYVKYLTKELALQRRLLGDADNLVSQLHWGGGTPTFLNFDEMARLMEATWTQFRRAEGGEYSIEIDPRKVDEKTVAYLAELGFNRMSIGVQDFDPDVQLAINRLQSEEETLAVVAAARAHGFSSISLDLIYGLPKQTPDGFARTLEKVIHAAPDRLSVYNYAHLPTLFKPQRRILSADLPSPSVRLEIMALAIEMLTHAGYRYIGMDHFAKPSDELAKAQERRELHRNFQGYSTQPDCDMLAFGVSSISKFGATYYQNHKTLDAYYAALDKHQLPVFRGILLNDDDRLRRAIIQALMCQFALSFAAIETAFTIDFKSYFSAELASFQPMADAGLLCLDEKGMCVLPKGRFLIRPIAMMFDRYLREKSAPNRYSKVI